jgi:hypothetical protein
MLKVIREELIIYHRWAKIKLTLQHDYHHAQLIHHDNHNKSIINVGQMIKLQCLNKRTENYESIILNHR